MFLSKAGVRKAKLQNYSYQRNEPGKQWELFFEEKVTKINIITQIIARF